jgi:hypothetical protein
MQPIENKVIHCTKPRIAILLTGQMRANSMNPEYLADTIIHDSIRIHFLNTEFTDRYDYDVFISTDKISLKKAYEFYGNNLKNVHITETDEYLYSCNRKIKNY